MSKEEHYPSCPPPPSNPQGEPVPPSYAEAIGSQPYRYAYPGQGPPSAPLYQHPAIHQPGYGPPPHPSVNQPGYGAPPMGFVPQVQGPIPTAYTQQPAQMYVHTLRPNDQPISIVTTIVPVGPEPAHLTCPHCQAVVDTTVKSSPSLWAWISGLALFAAGCWAGCCLIPCCMDGCMDKEHTCPSCKAHIGSYRRFNGR